MAFIGTFVTQCPIIFMNHLRNINRIWLICKVYLKQIRFLLCGDFLLIWNATFNHCYNGGIWFEAKRLRLRQRGLGDVVGFDHGLPCRVKNMARGTQQTKTEAEVFVVTLTLSQWSSSGNPVAIQCAWNLDPSVHWNATGEMPVCFQWSSSGLPVAFQWSSSVFQLCKLTLDCH